jgi:hypothetical protein
MTSGTGLIVRVSCSVTLTGVGAESVTFTVKVAAPAAVGIPEIFPDANVSPEGNEEPEARLQESVPVPPAALSVAL